MQINNYFLDNILNLVIYHTHISSRQSLLDASGYAWSLVSWSLRLRHLTPGATPEAMYLDAPGV